VKKTRQNNGPRQKFAAERRGVFATGKRFVKIRQGGGVFRRQTLISIKILKQFINY
jgi:hypothetical protein